MKGREVSLVVISLCGLGALERLTVSHARMFRGLSKELGNFTLKFGVTIFP